MYILFLYCFQDKHKVLLCSKLTYFMYRYKMKKKKEEKKKKKKKNKKKMM